MLEEINSVQGMIPHYSIHDFVGSLIDTDIYKLYVGQFAFHNSLFRGKKVTFNLFNRTPHSLHFPIHFDALLREVVQQMDELTFSNEQRNFLVSNSTVLKADYLDFLQSFHFNPQQVSISQSGPSLEVTITGPWEEVTYWEIPLMMVIIGLYNRVQKISPLSNWEDQLISVLQQFEKTKLPFSLFGTRRRFSSEVEKKVTELIKQYAPSSCMATSNPHMAHLFDLSFGGTNPHELYMAHAGVYGYKQANCFTLLNWHREYGNTLATALTDTFTTEVFWQDFQKFTQKYPEIANSYTKFRTDSGDEKLYTQNLITYWKLNKPSQSLPTIVYSNALDAQKALELHRYTTEIKIPHLLGIGSYLTHTITGHQAKDIVIKMTQFDGKDICKLTDDPQKATGTEKEIKRTTKMLNSQ